MTKAITMIAVAAVITKMITLNDATIANATWPGSSLIDPQKHTIKNKTMIPIDNIASGIRFLLTTSLNASFKYIPIPLLPFVLY